MGLCALMMGTMSCQKGAAGVSEEDKQMGDSLSMAIGSVMGAQLKGTIERQMQLDGVSELDVQKVIRGMEAALYADTTDARSYIQGLQMGLTLLNQPIVAMERDGFPADANLILKAFKEALEDSVTADAYWRQYQELDRRSKTVVQAREIKKNGAAGVEYVDSVKQANPQVVTTESGLSYLIEAEGEAARATANDTVLVNYTGALIDGTVFDDHSTGEPAKFPLKGVVKGFAEGLQLIGEGGKAVLYIPGELGYGDNGQPRAGIAPNATLVFNVELVKILPGPAEEEK